MEHTRDAVREQCVGETSRRGYGVRSECITEGS